MTDNTSSLSPEQRREIRDIYETIAEDLFIHTHSQSILGKVKNFVYFFIIVISTLTAWLGYGTYQDIKGRMNDAVSREVAGQVENLVKGQSIEIQRQVREAARTAAKEIADQEVDKVVAEGVTPKVKNALAKFETDLSEKSTKRFDELNDTMARIFPVLDSLQTLSDEGLGNIATRFKAIEDSGVELRLRSEAQDVRLTRAANELSQVHKSMSTISAEVEKQGKAISIATTSIAKLEKRLNNLTQVREATNSICALFSVVPKTRIVNLLGYPIPADDLELPNRISDSLNRIDKSCNQL